MVNVPCPATPYSAFLKKTFRPKLKKKVIQCRIQNKKRASDRSDNKKTLVSNTLTKNNPAGLKRDFLYEKKPTTCCQGMGGISGRGHPCLRGKLIAKKLFDFLPWNIILLWNNRKKSMLTTGC
jgi:hypothetical protein